MPGRTGALASAQPAHRERAQLARRGATAQAQGQGSAGTGERTVGSCPRWPIRLGGTEEVRVGATREGGTRAHG